MCTFNFIRSCVGGFWFDHSALWQEGQLELKELTAASLDKLLDGHSALQAQQGKLFEGQGHMENSLRDNLERLGQEKALIVSGQELVAQLIQGITKRMGESTHALRLYFIEVVNIMRGCMCM